MNYLVVGESSESRDLYESLSRGGGSQVAYMESSGSAIDAIRSGGQSFGWIFLESVGPHAETQRVANALRAADCEARISIMRHLDEGEEESEPCAPLLCAIETTPNGMQHLRCALRHIRMEPARNPALADAVAEIPHATVYLAPCKKSG